MLCSAFIGQFSWVLLEVPSSSWMHAVEILFHLAFIPPESPLGCYQQFPPPFSPSYAQIFSCFMGCLLLMLQLLVLSCPLTVWPIYSVAASCMSSN
jgi:hypothetical protein